MQVSMIFSIAVMLMVTASAPLDRARAVRIGVIQMHIADSDREDNLRRAAEWIRKGVRESSIQIAVLPESFDIGWINPRAKQLAEPIPGHTSKRLAALARELKIYIVGTVTERDRDKVYDAAFLIGPTGDILGKHRKINILKWPKPQYTGNVYYTPVQDLGHFISLSGQPARRGAGRAPSGAEGVLPSRGTQQRGAGRAERRIGGKAHAIGVIPQRHPGPVEHVGGEVPDREPARVG